jgi:tetratricopeptide (TPR) repeat protein
MVGDIPKSQSRLDDLLAGAPGPANAADAAGLLDLLRELRRWAGQPSLRRLRMLGGKTTAVSGDVIDALPISTTSTVLAGKRLPLLPRGEFLDAFVRACLRARAVPSEAIAEEIDGWMAARHRIEANAEQRDAPRPVPDLPACDDSDAGAASQPVLRQLPGPHRAFVGRCRELECLTDLVKADAGTMTIAAISGPGGVGKTWFALHWAHQNIRLFPDGQLYVNLHGFDPVEKPVQPAECLRTLLATLGVESSAVPGTLPAQAAMYRSLVAGKRMLIVLDNARNSAQVESLLPGSPTCTVLVTSRSQLCGVVTGFGAHPLTLQVLDADEAHGLLRRRLHSSRLAAEPEAASEILDRCAGLPLALSIAAAQAASNPALSLAMLSRELSEATDRLDALSTGDLSANLRAVFSSSYRALETQPARVFCRLGLFIGPDIGLAAVASLMALPIGQTRRYLRDLEDANLVQRCAADRYRMHDLLRSYSNELVQECVPVAERNEALRRLVHFYLHSAHACDEVFEWIEQPLDIGPPPSGCVPCAARDRAGALGWFEAEYPCLLAAQDTAVRHGWNDEVWHLAHTLAHFHRWRGHLQNNLAVWRAGLIAAERLGDPARRAHAHRELGAVCFRLDRYAEANDHLRCALTLLEAIGDTFSLARVHESFATALGYQGDNAQAFEHASHGLRLFQRLGSDKGEAGALNAVGWFHAKLGRYCTARDHCERSLALYRRHGNWFGEASALDSLGYIAAQTGDHALAIRHYNDVLALHRANGNVFDEADALKNLGDSYAALGEVAKARHNWLSSADHYRRHSRHGEVEKVHRRLRELDGGGS